MKKTLVFLLSALIILSLFTACVQSPDTSSKAEATSSTASEVSTPDQSKEVKLRFAAMSDIHINGSTSQTEYKRFQQALDFMYSYSNEQSNKAFDLLLVAGDMTNYGYENELKAFNAVVTEKIKEGTEKLFVMGNHEFYNNDANDVAQKRWEDITGETKNSHKVVNGYHFIGVSPNSGSDFTYITKWVDDEIQKAIAEDPGKPIFFTQHHHISDTVYGSDDWGTNQLSAVLNKYPQIVNFSGHSHYPVNDPRSISQKNFTALGCGTLSYFELEKGMVYGTLPPGNTNAAQFWVVEVYSDNSIMFKPYDLITKQFFPVDYKIENPTSKDSFVFTDKRADASKAPSFASTAKLEVKDIKEKSASLVFDHATGDDIVHSYLYHFTTKSDNKIALEFKTFSDFYYLSRPEKMTYLVTGLKPGTEYSVKITAINSYGKQSENSLKYDFKTTGEPEAPIDPNAPLPDADFLDVVFGKDGAKDNGKLKKTVENLGNAVIAQDAKLANAYTAQFKGSGDYFRVKFDKSEYDTLTETISLSSKFMINKINTSDYMDALGNMQTGGYGFEITTGSVLEFWISINGTYTVLNTPVEANKYYTVTGTYDGTKAILYVNGEKVAEQGVSGYITYPADTSAHAMCIGADVAPGGSGSSFFNGNVAYVKIHSTALTEKQVKELASK